MERKEAYEQIKKLGLQEECKKKFGKNFTQCKTSELEAVIKAFTVGVGTKVKTTKAASKTTIKIEESENSFSKLLDILMRRHLLLEADVNEILG